MRRKLLFACFLLTNAAYAQDKDTTIERQTDQKWIINVTGGSSFPLGDFGSTEITNERAGLTKVGVSSRIRASYEVSEKLYITADAVWFYNPLDADKLLTAFKNDNPSSIYDSYKLTTRAWKVYGLMGGVCKGFSMGEFDLELRALVGPVQGIYPKINIEQKDFDADTSNSFSYSAKSVIQLAMDLGFDFKINIKKNIGISFGGDFMQTELRFRKRYIEFSGNKEEIRNYTQPVSAFQFSAGIFVRL